MKPREGILISAYEFRCFRRLVKRAPNASLIPRTKLYEDIAERVAPLLLDEIEALKGKKKPCYRKPLELRW